eukprot:m.181820 g.181820  ORF g.181820 m.181820 type:complete len:1658 (-) comp21495_c0_seq1:114-5087(-)
MSQAKNCASTGWSGCSSTGAACQAASWRLNLVRNRSAFFFRLGSGALYSVCSASRTCSMSAAPRTTRDGRRELEKRDTLLGNLPPVGLLCLLSVRLEVSKPKGLVGESAGENRRRERKKKKMAAAVRRSSRDSPNRSDTVEAVDMALAELDLERRGSQISETGGEQELLPGMLQEHAVDDAVRPRTARGSRPGTSTIIRGNGDARPRTARSAAGRGRVRQLDSNSDDDDDGNTPDDGAVHDRTNDSDLFHTTFRPGSAHPAQSSRVPVNEGSTDGLNTLDDSQPTSNGHLNGTANGNGSAPRGGRVPGKGAGNRVVPVNGFMGDAPSSASDGSEVRGFVVGDGSRAKGPRRVLVGEADAADSMEMDSDVDEQSLALALSSSMQGTVVDGDTRREDQAYVPLHLATDRIHMLLRALHTMKDRHVGIVQELDQSYRSIEQETHSNFRTFVQKLKDKYRSQAAAWKQLLLAHRDDLVQAQKAFQSERERSAKLVAENAALLAASNAAIVTSTAQQDSLLTALRTELQEKTQQLQAERAKVQKLQTSGGGRVAVLTTGMSRPARSSSGGDKVNPRWKLQKEYLVLLGRTPAEEREETADGIRTQLNAEENEATAQLELTLTEIDAWCAEYETREGNPPTEEEQEQQIGHLLSGRDAALQRKEDIPARRRALEAAVRALAADPGAGDDDDDEDNFGGGSLSENGAAPIAMSVDSAVRFLTDDNTEIEIEDVLNTLREQLDTAKEEAANARAELSAWQEEFVQTNGTQPDDSAIQDHSELFERVDTSQAQETQLRKQVAVLQAATGSVSGNGESDRGSEYRDRIAELEEDLAEQSSASRQAVASAVAAALAAAPSSAEDQKTIADLRDQLQAAQTLLSEKQSNFELERLQHEAKIRELEQKELQLSSDHAALVSERRSELSNLEIALTTLKQELTAKQQSLEEQKAAVKTLQEEQLKGLELDVAKEITDLRTELEGKKDAIDALRQQLTESQGEVQRNEAAAAAATATAESVRNELETVKKVNVEMQERFAGQLSALSSTIADNSARRADADAQRLQELKDQLDASQKQNVELISERALLQQQVKTIQESKRASAEERAALRKLETAEKECARLRDENIRLKEGGAVMATKGSNAADSGGGGGSSAAGANLSGLDRTKLEKRVRDAEKRVELYKKQDATQKEEVAKSTQKLRDLERENKRLDTELKAAKAELGKVNEAAREGLAAVAKAEELSVEVKNLRKENLKLAEDFQQERVLRKKYYNQIEDMKGKIRVYCRARPLSGTEKGNGNSMVVTSPDEYSIVVQNAKARKEFQFDQVFMPGASQEQVYEDTHNLIQTAVDGYNVCIFAYGQTGSGKTFTMIGDSNRPMNFPGLAPRAFEDIFAVIESNKSKFSFRVSCYMIELYCDRLIDLFGGKHAVDPEKLKVRKDKKGMVVVDGSIIREANSAAELYALFEEGSAARHTASTKMNAESSRSHLVIAVIIESTNLLSGQVVAGKLSLVDLAGSERAGKTGATGQQIVEARSINKSLSALGDVISALSSDQKFIPYRNNILTQLMQDSLGGNAKTLMFVNISPADYNFDETVISLTYASRVKLITNDAQKNAESKEVARLKKLIEKLKKGEAVDEDDVADEEDAPPDDYVPPNDDDPARLDGYSADNNPLDG